MNLIVGLMATHPRETSLRNVSIPSIARQSRLPDALVIVSDTCRLPESAEKVLQALLPQTPIYSIPNLRAKGAAGAWNTGLHYIHQYWPNAYVAILDDDDTWDVDHLYTCWDVAKNDNWPDVVVSGLRMSKDGAVISRPPPETLCVEDFLVGNPGWQGSNTFASISSLLKAGGFTDGLSSCNDRDLAIRVLGLPDTRISYTGTFTATWNLNASPDCLSQVGLQKQEALKKFFALHGHRMSAEVKQRFLKRCKDLFGVSGGCQGSCRIFVV